jgi:alpha-1,6-mannosyltransferase
MKHRQLRMAAALFLASAVGLWGLSWVFPERVQPWVRLATGLPWPPYLSANAAAFALIALHATQCGAYVWALWSGTRAAVPPRWRTIVLVVALCAPFYLLSGSLLSADAYLYTAYGRMTWLGFNPYLHTPVEFPNDPVIGPLSAWWSKPTPYGPVWTALWTGLAGLVGAGPGTASTGALLAGLLSGRVLAAGTYVFGVWLLSHLSNGRRWAAWALAWNPLVLQEALGNGRIDVPFAMLALAVVWLARERSWLRGAAALGVAMAMRFTGIVLAPLYLLEAYRDGRNWRRAGLAALLAAGVLVLSYAPYWVGLETLTGLAQAGETYNRKTGSAVILSLLTRVVPNAPPWSGWVIAGVVGAGLMVLWLARVRGGLAANGAFAYALYLLLVSPHTDAWYVVWPVVLALAASAQGETDRPGQWLWIGVGLSIWGLGLYQMWQIGQWELPDVLRAVYLLALLAWPLGALALYFARARARTRPAGEAAP